MYHPYVRGKQYELLALRESADTLAAAEFVSVVEPVRSPLTGLARALDTLTDAGAQAIVIVNPRYGDLRGEGPDITALLTSQYKDADGIAAGILLHSSLTVKRALQLIDAHADLRPVLVHAGFTEPRALAEELGSRALSHVFVEDHAGSLYRAHFAGHKVLLRDGFQVMNNADYAASDYFSDLHVTFPKEDAEGYGDFLTVGDRFAEGGGPAYAVAIHLTFIDPANDDAMFVHHFVSDSNGTPSDAAGKFREALAKLVAEIDSAGTPHVHTSAVDEFRRLHATGHFPGLGYVKKLSMRHHIETLARFHARP